MKIFHFFSTIIHVVILSALSVYSANAKEEIIIADLRIVYERGFFDETSFSGDISDIRFYMGSDYLGSSDRVVIDYNISGGVFDLNTFLVQGLRMKEDGVDIFIDRFSIENMVIDNQVFNLMAPDSLGTPKIYKTGDILIEDVNFEFDGSRISLDKFYLSNINLLPFQASYIPDYDSEIYLDRFTVALSPYDPTLAEYHMILNMLGINDITLNMNSVASHRNVGDRYRQVGTSEIELIGFGSLESYSDIEYLKQSYHMLNQTNFENIDPDQALLLFSSLGGGIFFNSFELSYTDKGLMDYAFTFASQSTGMNRNDIADMSVMMMQTQLMQFPDIANMVIPPVERFIRRGGRIVISIEPTVNLPVISLVPLMASPADAINVLGVRVYN